MGEEFTLKELEKKLEFVEKNYDPNTKTIKTWYGLDFKMEMKDDVDKSYVDIFKRKIVVKKEEDIKSTLKSTFENIYACRWLPVTISGIIAPTILFLLGKIDLSMTTVTSLGFAYLSRVFGKMYASDKIKELYILDEI
jgi:hypothetical protein